MRVKHRHALRRRDVKNLIEELSNKFPELLEVVEIEGIRHAKVELLITDKEHEVYVLDGKPVIIKYSEIFYPTIEVANQYSKRLPRVVVDRGAVPHIANGADVMAPGIVRVDGAFSAGDIVLIAEETYGRVIAIGRALVSSNEIGSRGKVVENLHYVGDRLWRLLREIYG